MVNKKEILLNGKLYEVETLANYVKNPDAYLNGYIAIETVGYVLPVISNSDQGPGIIVRKSSPFSYTSVPVSELSDQYKSENIIDYSKATSFKEFIETQNMVRKIEKDILTSPDNIYTPPEDPNDSAAMKALKQAVIDKHIDLDLYEPRFGSNYNNDKRIFTKNNISLPMLVRMCNALDIKATLTLEDQLNDNGEVPNPMDNVISVELTSKIHSSANEE